MSPCRSAGDQDLHPGIVRKQTSHLVAEQDTPRRIAQASTETLVHACGVTPHTAGATGEEGADYVSHLKNHNTTFFFLLLAAR